MRKFITSTIYIVTNINTGAHEFVKTESGSVASQHLLFIHLNKYRRRRVHLLPCHFLRAQSCDALIHWGYWRKKRTGANDSWGLEPLDKAIVSLSSRFNLYIFHSWNHFLCGNIQRIPFSLSFPWGPQGISLIESSGRQSCYVRAWFLHTNHTTQALGLC